MKTFVPVKKHTLFVTVTLLLVNCMFAPLQSFAGSPSPLHGNDTIEVQKQQVSKKYKVRLYPDAANEVLFFSASGHSGKVYQLFMFDMGGRLVKQVNIKNKQITILNQIDKGNYLFEVFSDDTRIGNGQVIVH